MSFFYPSPAAVARSRRARDNMKSNAGSTAGRRAKDSSKPREEKSTPSCSPPATNAMSSEPSQDASQSSGALSRTSTPCLLPGSNITAGPDGVYQLPVQLVTPAALQQYLDKDTGTELPVDSGEPSDSATLVQSMPDLKAVRITDGQTPCEDSKSVKSEPADPPQERTPHPHDSEHVKAESPTSHSSAASLAGQSDLTQERSNTPPPLPPMSSHSYSPPPYMSPIPVRVHPFNQHFLSYQGNHGYPLNHGGSSMTDGNPQFPMHGQYYADYSARFHYPAPGQMQRTHTQDMASVPQRKSNRRPVSYASADEDVFSLLNRINSVLPDFHTLLDRYEETSTQLSGETKSRRQSENHLKDAVKERDEHIARLRREIETANEIHQVESEKLQAELCKVQTTQRELEQSLLARTKSRDNLREKSDQLQRSYDDLSTRSRQIEVALESFRAWTLQDMEAKERSARPVTSEKVSQETKDPPKSPVSPEPSVPGGFTDSRRPSPLPVDGENVVGQEMAELLEVARTKAREAQLKEVKVREGWHAEIQAWRLRDAHLREVFQQEHEAQSRQWEEEQAELRRQWVAHQQLANEQHEQEKTELHHMLEATQTRNQARCSELEADNKDLRDQVEHLKAQLASERSRWSHSAAEFKAAAIRVDRETRHLRHLLETHEPAMPIRRSNGEGRATEAHAAVSGYIGQLE